MPIPRSKPQTPVPKSAIGSRQSAIVFSLLLVAGLVGLYFSDRALRRMEKMDDVVLRGQTGLPWIDDFLSRRAAARAKQAKYEAELKKLIAVVSAARTLPQRIAAHYAVARLETTEGRPDSPRIKEAWLFITREGRSMPETVEAWQGLLRLAHAKPDHPDPVSPLLEGYFASVTNMASSSAKFTYLQDVWRIAQRNRLATVELAALEVIFAEFPREPEALNAYEALAQKYRLSGPAERLEAVEQAAKDASEQLMMQRSQPKKGKKK